MSSSLVRRLNRRLMSVALTLVLAIIGTLFSASPALAKPAPARFSDCPPSRVCVWKNIEGDGQMYYWTGPFNQCIPIGGSWNDSISSASNRWSPVSGYFGVTFFEHAGCPWNGPGWKLGLGMGWNVTFGFDKNDEASSLWISH